MERPSNPLLREQVDVVLGQEGRAPMLEIMSGEKKVMSEKVAGIMAAFLAVACQDKKAIDLNYNDLMEKVTRSKEKEKDQIVEFLTELTDEERESLRQSLIESRLLRTAGKVINYDGNHLECKILEDDTFECDLKLPETV